MTVPSVVLAAALLVGVAAADSPAPAIPRSVTLDDEQQLPLDAEGLLVPNQLGDRFVVGWDGPVSVAESEGPIRVRLRDAPLTLDLRTAEGRKQAVVRLRAVAGEAHVELRLRSAAGKYPVRLEIRPMQADRDAEVRSGGEPVKLSLHRKASEVEIEPVEGAIPARVVHPADR